MGSIGEEVTVRSTPTPTPTPTRSPGFAEELRRIYPRVIAKTLAVTRGRLPDAEDAVQDAIERALTTWPERGKPESPEAWLVTVAANSHRDRERRSVRAERHAADAVAELAEMSPWVRIALGEREVGSAWKDDLLRLLFACCDPTALEPGESAALALATVIGLSTDEIARAFLVSSRTMEQRLSRARKRLRDQGGPGAADDYESIRPEEVGDRVCAILRVVHLLFNEGYWSASDDEAPIRGDLCRLAVGLARSLHEEFPNEPETAGLLALLLFHDARRTARLSDDGKQVIPLPDQNRDRWDQDGIRAATSLLDRALAMKRPGAFQIEAAISAVHCRARTAKDTDWQEIADLYALLERAHRPTRVVRVNRAFAVSRATGPEAGLALLDDHGGPSAEATEPYEHLVRGTLLEDLGQWDAAIHSLEQALTHTRNIHERIQIEKRLARCRTAKR